MSGCGLSDSGIDEFAIAMFVNDLAAVVKASGADTFALLSLGMLGGPTAITYAATHPDGVSHLVLWKP